MENVPGYEMNSEPSAPMPEQTVIYPPKFQQVAQPANVWMKSILSLALYLVLGYIIFKTWEMLLLITAIVIFHELGHFFAMKAFRYKDLGIFFIPLLGAYVSGTKREVSQKESAIILLAGPLPGIILGLVFYFLYKNDPGIGIGDISLYTISLAMIILNLINLLPIYPLDGGQLLNRVFLDEEGWISKAFVFLSAGFLVWVVLKVFGPSSYPLLIFPALMLLRLFGDSKISAIEKKIEAAGINMDCSYEDMPDEDYWKVRNILIEDYNSFRDIPPSPPYEYHAKEEKVMNMIKSLLHRHLINDVSILGKILIFLICVAAFASPWLFNIDMSFLRRFGV